MARQILVVDDDAGIRAVLKMALEDEGYLVSLATNGCEALDRIAERAPALILLDLNMPVMTGWELQDRLRNRQSTIPVIFMTAGSCADVEAMRHHAAGSLCKPFGLDEVLDAVAQFAA